MNETTSQLKSVIYLMVAKIVEEQLDTINKEQQENITTSPIFVASLVELVYNQLIGLGTDLELFANHAGRDIINVSDLLMAIRKNDVLTEYIKSISEK